MLGLLLAAVLVGVAQANDAERLATARSMLQLASGYMQQGRPNDGQLEQALPLTEAALAWHRQRGDLGSVQAIETTSNLASIESALGHHAKAVSLDEAV